MSSYPDIHMYSHPVIQLSSYPAIQLSSYPVIQLSSYPVIQLSSYPVIQLSSYPAIQLSLTLNVTKMVRKDNLKMVLMSAHNVNMLCMKNALINHQMEMRNEDKGDDRIQHEW